MNNTHNKLKHTFEEFSVFYLEALQRRKLNEYTTTPTVDIIDRSYMVHRVLEKIDPPYLNKLKLDLKNKLEDLGFIIQGNNVFYNIQHKLNSKKISDKLYALTIAKKLAEETFK